MAASPYDNIQFLLGAVPARPQPVDYRFHWWQGASGRCWITTVMDIDDRLPSLSSVYVIVRREKSGRRTPLYFGQTNDSDRRMGEHHGDKLYIARLLGANEVHVHLLAETKSQRLAIETDLRNGHSTVLNMQGGGLMALGSWSASV